MSALCPPRSWGIKIQKFFCFGLIIAEIALPFALLLLKMKSHFDFFTRLGVSGIIVAVAAYVGCAIADRIMQRQNVGTNDIQSLAGSVVIAVVVFGGFFLWQQPIIDTFRTERPFIEEVKAQADGLSASSIGFFPKNDAKLLFYLDKKKPISVLRTASDWDSFLSGQTPKLVIMQSRDEEKIPADYRWFLQKQPDIIEKVQPWDSASSRRKKWCAWIIKGDSVLSQSVSKEEDDKNYAN